MTLSVAVLVVVGLAGVPVLLLWAGRRFRSFSAPALGAFRGAVVGYAFASLVVAALLLAPPHVWPPASTATRLTLVFGLLAGPALGALVGVSRRRDRHGG